MSEVDDGLKRFKDKFMRDHQTMDDLVNIFADVPDNWSMTLELHAKLLERAAARGWSVSSPASPSVPVRLFQHAWVVRFAAIEAPVVQGINNFTVKAGLIEFRKPYKKNVPIPTTVWQLFFFGLLERKNTPFSKVAEFGDAVEFSSVVFDRNAFIDKLVDTWVHTLIHVEKSTRYVEKAGLT